MEATKSAIRVRVPRIVRPAPDRTIRALMSLVDDLTRGARGGGAPALDARARGESLGLTSGVTFVLGEDGELRTGAEFRFPDGGYAPATSSRQAL